MAIHATGGTIFKAGLYPNPKRTGGEYHANSGAFTGHQKGWKTAGPTLLKVASMLYVANNELIIYT
jgi:hypothetical protein